MLRRFILLTLLFCFFATIADAQKRRKRGGSFSRKKPPYRYEWVGALGASNFLGDLGGANQIGTNGLKDLEYVLTRPAVGAGIRIKLQQFITGKANLTWGIVRGDDKLTKEPFRNYRNLNFRSPIIELSGQLEFNFMREQKGHIYRIRGVRGMKHKDRQFYIFVGGGGSYFNPKGKYTDGRWYALRKYGTEGQGIISGTHKYIPFTPVIMMGGGFRLAINRYWGIGFELGMRKSFTDYMDDVSTEYAAQLLTDNNADPKAVYFADPSSQQGLYGSDITADGQQRGDKTDKDAYMFATFTVGYKVMFRKRSRSKF